jgi:hypothetical protein
MKTSGLQIDLERFSLEGRSWTKKFNTLSLYHYFRGFSAIAIGQGCCVITGKYTTSQGSQAVVFPECYPAHPEHPALSHIYTPYSNGKIFYVYGIEWNSAEGMTEEKAIEKLLSQLKIPKAGLKLISSRLAVF